MGFACVFGRVAPDEILVQRSTTMLPPGSAAPEQRNIIFRSCFFFAQHMIAMLRSAGEHAQCEAFVATYKAQELSTFSPQAFDKLLILQRFLDFR
jgi:hypothetical protein